MKVQFERQHIYRLSRPPLALAVHGKTVLLPPVCLGMQRITSVPACRGRYPLLARLAI